MGEEMYSYILLQVSIFWCVISSFCEINLKLSVCVRSPANLTIFAFGANGNFFRNRVNVAALFL